MGSLVLSTTNLSSLGSSLLSPVADSQHKVGNTTAYGTSALQSSWPNLDNGGMSQYFVQYVFVTRIEKAHQQSQIGLNISVCAIVINSSEGNPGYGTTREGAETYMADRVKSSFE